MFFTGLSKFLQVLIDILGVSVNALLLVFPSSPFTLITNSSYSDLLGQINYFVPVGEFVAITESWIVAVALYYVYSVYARFLKAID